MCENTVCKKYDKIYIETNKTQADNSQPTIEIRKREKIMFNIFKKKSKKINKTSVKQKYTYTGIDPLKQAVKELEECYELSKKNAAKLIQENINDYSDFDGTVKMYKDPKDQMEAFLNSVVPDMCKCISHMVKFCYKDPDYFQLPEFPKEEYLKTEGNYSKLRLLFDTLYSVFTFEAMDARKFPPMPFLFVENIFTKRYCNKIESMYGKDTLSKVEYAWDYDIDNALTVLTNIIEGRAIGMDGLGFEVQSKHLWTSVFSGLDYISDSVYRREGKYMFNKNEYMELIPEKVETF